MAVKYEVIEKGYIDRVYNPGETLVVDKPFEKVPSWLKPVKVSGEAKKVELTAQQKAAATKAAKKAAAAEAEKQADIDEASEEPVDFTGDEKPQTTATL